MVKEHFIDNLSILSISSDINGILLFYRKTKLDESSKGAVDLLTIGLGNLNKSPNGGGLYPGFNGGGNNNRNSSLTQEPNYENLKTQSPAGFPVRPAPRPPAPLPARQTSIFNTLGPNYSELDGVPFQLAAQLRKGDSYSLPQNLFAVDSSNLGYDFELERQVLCTTKAITSTNPFFN